MKQFTDTDLRQAAIEAARELDGKKIGELTPWQSLISGVQWMRANQGHGINAAADDMIARMLRIRKNYDDSFPPLDMLIYCPNCGRQHIDREETLEKFLARCGNAPGNEAVVLERWTNPPHKIHLCLFCEFQWRHANVPTNGVEFLYGGKGFAMTQKAADEIRKNKTMLENEIRQRQALQQALDKILGTAKDALGL